MAKRGKAKRANGKVHGKVHGKPLGTLRSSGLTGVLFGSLLLWRGRELFSVVQQRRPSSGEEDAVRILGVRHLGQGVLQLLVPRHLGFLYAGIDGIHAASMVAIAAKDHDRSKAALTSGGIAAVSGLLAGRSALIQKRSRS